MAEGLAKTKKIYIMKEFFNEPTTRIDGGVITKNND